jgi:hypothetical protein
VVVVTPTITDLCGACQPRSSRAVVTRVWLKGTGRAADRVVTVVWGGW